MDNKQLNFYMTTIGEMILEDTKIVTYKSLSTSLGIHVNTAKQLLYAFLTQQKKNSFPVTATYLLAGKLENLSNAITIVSESEKEKEMLKFLEITSDHIYSIQNTKLNNISALCGISIHEKDFKKQIVIRSPKCVMKSKKKISDFHHETSSKINSVPVNNCENNIKCDTSITTKKNNNLIDSNKLIFKNCNEERLEKKAKNKICQKTTKNITSIKNIAPLFVNSAQKSANKTNNVSVSKSMTSVKTNIFVNKAENMDEKSNAETLKKKKSKDFEKKKKEKGVKRKRIQLLSSDSDDNSFDSSAEGENLFDKSSVPVQSFKTDENHSFGKVKSDEGEEDCKPKNKIKKRKIIDITVMNEDGYLETRKEVITLTDSEEENILNPPVNKLNQVSETNKQLKSESKINKVVLKKQSSLLSFFKKN